MKKIIVTLAVLLLAAPVMADVTITCTPGPGPNDVTVSFSVSSETELVRAIALDIQVDDPCASIVDINCVHTGYNIHPTNIDIVGGVMQDPEPDDCAGVHDPNKVISEQGSLYASGEDPPVEGDLFIITLGGCGEVGSGGDVVVTVSENALRGGIVMENADGPDGSVISDGITVNLGECVGCVCLGDTKDSTGTGPPDGTVNFGDLMAIYNGMTAVYPTGDPTFVYDIGIPVGLECADITGTTGSGPPDGTIDFGDLMGIYNGMTAVYPTGDPAFVYNIGCPF